jgi:hypothetical protein
MLQSFTSHHFTDGVGFPAGGHSFGPGFSISWQNGPLGNGENRLEPNGAFVETVLAAVRDRIEFYNNVGFSCEENQDAIHHINRTLECLNNRTARRTADGTEGTHAGN